MLRVHFAAIRVATMMAALSVGMPLTAGTLTFGAFAEFSFTDAGTPATGCDPADPAGGFCIPSSGTPTTFLDAPPWTFTAPSFGVFLSVTDAFLSGDQFEVFDNGVSIGQTSLFTPGVDCGDDPTICITTPGMSASRILLAAGDHSITIVPLQSAGGGSGFLQAAVATPEPSTLILLAAGLGMIMIVRRRQAQLIRLDARKLEARK